MMDLLSVLAILVAIGILLTLGPKIFTTPGRQRRFLERLEEQKREREEREERARSERAG